jgi:acyl-CoA thioester hydrolase
MRRKRKGYFKLEEGAPLPIEVSVKCRAMFSQVDAMGVVWYGRYVEFFERASLALGERCGFSYTELVEQKLMSPIVQCHIDYIRPILLDMEFNVRASLQWSDSASLKVQYELTDDEAVVLATGYTVQLFVDAISKEHLLVSPDAVLAFRERWKNGEISSDE